MLGIYGCGGFGRESLQWWLDQCANRATGSRDPHGDTVFIDDQNKSDAVNGIQVVGLHDFVRKHPKGRVVISLGDPKARRVLTEKCVAAGVKHFGSIVHPTAVISSEARVNYEGFIAAPFAIVCPNAVIDAHCHLNIYSYVAHDATLGAFVTLAPRASVNGRVHVGARAYIGTGAVIREGKPDAFTQIGADAVVGAGAVVLANVEVGTTVGGVPAKPLPMRHN